MYSSEETLIQHLQSGSESAYQYVFDAYYELLISYAGKYISSKDACREVVQTVMVRLYEKRETLQIQKLKPYLLKSVYHACLQEIRSWKDFVENQESDTVLDYDLIEQAEREAEIWRKIESLPPKCRDIFVMNRFDGLKNQEIANQLGLSIRTVETQISIALKNLRDSILLFFL